QTPQAEVRFIEYPEVFQDSAPDFILPLIRNGIFGLLKAEDQKGRRIICYNGGKWNPDEISIQQLTTAGTFFLDLALRDKYSMINNGLIFIQNNSGLGMKHVKPFISKKFKERVSVAAINIRRCKEPAHLKGYLSVGLISIINNSSLFQQLTKDLRFSTKIFHQPSFQNFLLGNEEAFDKDILGLIK
ncbi:Retinaldehyde-binding protein 1, partial [Orchesella cincta]